MRFPNQEKNRLHWRNEKGIAKGPVILLIAAMLIIGIAAFQFMQSRPVDHTQENRKTGQLSKLDNPTADMSDDQKAKADKKDGSQKTARSAASNKHASEKSTVAEKGNPESSSEALYIADSNVKTAEPGQQNASAPPAAHMQLAQTGSSPQVQTGSNKTKQPTVATKPAGNLTGSQNTAASANGAVKKETFAEMIARARKSLFTIYNVKDDAEDEYTILQGSTFLYNNKGMLVTNGHVVEGAKTVGVIAANGKKYTGTVVGFAYNPDVALIHVPKLSGQKAFPIDSSKYGINSPVAAIANHLDVKTTKGKIIEKDLNMKTDPDDPYFYPNMYVTTAATPPGFSGGPLISTKTNKIIGINSLHSLTEEGIGYSMPFKEAEKLLKKWNDKPMTEKQIAALYKNPAFQDSTTAKKTTVKKEDLKQVKDTDKKKSEADKAKAAAKQVVSGKKDASKENGTATQNDAKTEQPVTRAAENKFAEKADAEPVASDNEADTSLPAAETEQDAKAGTADEDKTRTAVSSDEEAVEQTTSVSEENIVQQQKKKTADDATSDQNAEQ